MEYTCAAHDARYEFNYTNGHPVTFNHIGTSKFVAEVLLKYTEAAKVQYGCPPVMAGEDFGHYAQKIPACFIFLGCRNEEKGITALLHNPYFDIDEDCIEQGIRLWANIALTPYSIPK